MRKELKDYIIEKNVVNRESDWKRKLMKEKVIERESNQMRECLK